MLGAVGAFSLSLFFATQTVFARPPNRMPDAKRFLVVDSAKCMGCGTCMMACSLAHTGEVSYSLGRIQIQQNSFSSWPEDVSMSVCLQCADAPCVQACPVGANMPDAAHGDTRTIDPLACVGCGDCIDACPYTPSRVQWNPAKAKAQKCDLCQDTPFLGEKGGAWGTQACVKVCPVKAIAVVSEMPTQGSAAAYVVNLRGEGWARLGLSTE